MLNVKEKINAFKEKYKNKCFALVNWKNLQMKDYGLNEMLTCICNEANGSLDEMANIIDHLTSKNKTFGRTQVYAKDIVKTVDLIRNSNGELELKGYNPKAELPLKGQHLPKNNKIFRKSDDSVSKTYQKSEDRLLDLGVKVREIFPGESNHFITMAMQAIRSYAEQKKIHTDKVINGLKKNRYRLDSDIWRIIPNAVRENKHTIVVNESEMKRIIDMIDMTEQKFHANMRHFISMLLQDPVNATVPYIFSQRNYTRSMLLNYLLNGKDPILIRDQKICDKDENGQPKTATMNIKFRCPKKNFDRKLQKLYIRMFERNLPKPKPRNVENEIVLSEDGAAGATSAESSGAFVTGLSTNVQRRTMPSEIGESTTTFNTGDYTYTAPAFGDKETLKRHNGKGGSVSVNHVK